MNSMQKGFPDVPIRVLIKVIQLNEVVYYIWTYLINGQLWAGAVNEKELHEIRIEITKYEIIDLLTSCSLGIDCAQHLDGIPESSFSKELRKILRD